MVAAADTLPSAVQICARLPASSVRKRSYSILADVKFLSLLYLLACLTSASVCGLLIAASREIPRLSGRLEDLNAVQRAHDRLTPRVGGLGIIAGLLLGMLFVSFLFGDPGLGDGGKLLAGPVLLVVVALAEDLGFRIRPWTRLIATVLASLYVGLLTEIWLRNLGMGPLNPLFDPLWVAIPVTLFVTAMLSHGFNLIDGVNGLSSGVGLVGALGCSFISFQVGADAVGIIALILSAGIIGFMIFNFPFGWIFLGDTGAYLIGFVLAWLGITLVETSGSAVSPWALILLFFWPLADVVFAVFRRLFRGRSMFEPDKLHLHSIANRGLKVLARCYPVIERWRNPLTTVILLPLFLAPPLMGISFYENSTICFALVCCCTISYGALYFGTLPAYRLIRRWVRTRNRFRNRPIRK
ncbi:MAG: hypothetical protein CME02_04075 [Geminicoccus sp.]|nr:hypothetical protein [Geminicoccus sp.]